MSFTAERIKERLLEVTDDASDEIEALEEENARLIKLVELIFASTPPYRDDGECTFIDKVTDMWKEIKK